jgi:hypothetical protein
MTIETFKYIGSVHLLPHISITYDSADYAMDALQSDGYGGGYLSLARVGCTYEETHQTIPPRDGVR